MLAVIIINNVDKFLYGAVTGGGAEYNYII